MVFCLLVCWPEYDSACVIAPILLLPNVDGGGGIVFCYFLAQTQERRKESLHLITKVFASLLLDQRWCPDPGPVLCSAVQCSIGSTTGFHNHREGPSRGLLRDCITLSMDRFTAL